MQIWNKSQTAAQGDFEKNLDCCGWATKPVTVNGTVAHCSAACVTPGTNGTQTYENCYTCKETVEDKIDYAFNSSGGVGLFFAFTEVGLVVQGVSYLISSDSVKQNTFTVES